jgi:hypothetical protein
MKHVRFLLTTTCALTLPLMPQGLDAQEDSPSTDKPAITFSAPPGTS